MDRDTITNVLACGSGEITGTGLNHCPFDLKDMSQSGAIGFLNSGSKLPEDFTKDNLNKMIQKGQLTWLKGIFSVTASNGDNQRETGSGGIERLATEGLYKMTFTFTNGRYFNAALYSLQGFGGKELILSDGSNLEYRKGGRGYTIGQIEHVPYQRAEGATAAKGSITIQLTNRRQYEKDFAYISGESITDWSFDDLGGVNDLTMSFVNVPTNGDTSLKIKVIGTADSHVTEDLVISNFIVKADDVVVAATLGTSTGTDGIYDLTIPAVTTGQKYTVSTWDSSESTRGIINASGLVYKSNTATVVTIA